MITAMSTMSNTEAVARTYVTGWAHRRHWKPSYKTAKVEVDRATQQLVALALGVTEAQIAGLLATASHPPQSLDRRAVWIDNMTTQLLALT